jgi:hypothetical protein
VIKAFGNSARNVLSHEPYRIAREIDGIGFKTADRIAINLGFANDAPPRLDAGIMFALETLESEGTPLTARPTCATTRPRCWRRFPTGSARGSSTSWGRATSFATSVRHWSTTRAHLCRARD